MNKYRNNYDEFSDDRGANDEFGPVQQEATRRLMAENRLDAERRRQESVRLWETIDWSLGVDEIREILERVASAFPLEQRANYIQHQLDHVRPIMLERLQA